MRPPADRVVDRAISRAAVAGDRGALARALRLARSRGLGRAARSWACWIGWPAVLPGDRHGRGVCPSCGEYGALWLTVDPGQTDGDGPRCRPCWASAWEYGRAHVPEAWLVDGEWPSQSDVDGRFYFGCPEDGGTCSGWDSFRAAVEAASLPDPELRPAWVSEIPARAACGCCATYHPIEEEGASCSACGGRGVVEVLHAQGS